MIFFLEIDGELKRCMVKKPYSELLNQWNTIKRMQQIDSNGFEFCKDALRDVARACVESGAYEVISQ